MSSQPLLSQQTQAGPCPDGLPTFLGPHSPEGSGFLHCHLLPRRASWPESRSLGAGMHLWASTHSARKHVTCTPCSGASEAALCLQDELHISQLGVQDSPQSGHSLPLLLFLLRLPLCPPGPLSATPTPNQKTKLPLILQTCCLLPTVGFPPHSALRPGRLPPFPPTGLSFSDYHNSKRPDRVAMGGWAGEQTGLDSGCSRSELTTGLFNHVTASVSSSVK